MLRAAVVADDVKINVEFLHVIEQVQSTLPLLCLFQRTDGSIEADSVRNKLLVWHTRKHMKCALPLIAPFQHTDDSIVAKFVEANLFQRHFLKQVQSLDAQKKHNAKSEGIFLFHLQIMLQIWGGFSFQTWTKIQTSGL